MVCRPGFENDFTEKMRHSAAHVLADAVTRLFPTVKVAIGPVIENGFYYDFDMPEGFTPQDLENIENQINKIIKEDLPFQRIELSRAEAIKLFTQKNENYKVEIIQGLPENEIITLYQHGQFVDLCKGPHVSSTKDIKAVKIISTAGAYWRGNENNPMLQRIYATAFPSQQELKDYLHKLEEAKKRDHRKLGVELGLFSFHKESPASPFFKPKGALLYRLLVDYIRSFYRTEGYDEVITPQIMDVSLWQKSGHYDNFKENMYFTQIDEREFSVKPMNCPGHCLMFGEKKWSYRELPVRFADFGRLHRYERSGVTHGLTRVRTFCQDDAHIYCTPEQMPQEISQFLDLVNQIYRDFGFSDVHMALATRPEKYIGDLATWQKAETVLAEAMKQKNMDFSIAVGEGAFYGPKIEFQVKDALGRAWQLGTLQIDYSMPERFDLEYIDSEQNTHRPVMLHRAILGSLERFIGILIEHTAGKFPFFISPVQIKMIPIGDSVFDYASSVAKELQQKGFRVEIDSRNEKLGLKIRQAQLEKVPYMVVIGQKEAEAGLLSIRERTLGDQGTKTLAEFLSLLNTTTDPQS